jgi:hypothetical protein
MGIDPMNNILIITRILFEITLFQQNKGVQKVHSVSAAQIKYLG